MKRLGYEVALAKDGTEGIELYKKLTEENRPFDVVIVDLTIPGGMGGRQAIKELLKADPGAKAIVSSGYSDDPVMSRFKEYGFRDVLAKPYKIGDLAKTIEKVMRGD